MPPETTNAKLRWEDGDLPVSTRFEDPYYSRSDGLAESCHVFLDGNDLPDRFSEVSSFHIAELGFGTGLNVLAAVRQWQQSGQTSTLKLTSFEKYPISPAEMFRALSRWSDLSDLTETLLTQWPDTRISLPGAELRVIVGDVAETLPAHV